MPPRTIIQNRTIQGVGTEPNVDDMAVGEVVINTTDKVLFTRDDNGNLRKLLNSTFVDPDDPSTNLNRGTGEIFKVRGVAGNYVLQDSDDYTLLVCVGPESQIITIPDNVAFSRGFRCWIRQDFDDATGTKYVYVKTGDSINLTSYQGYTATAAQYATIEIINIAGSNWMLRGEGAVKTEPTVAAADYIPNKGVKYSSGNFLSGLNLAGQIADSKQWSFFTFVKLAQPTQDPGGDPDPGGGGNPPPATGNYRVFQGFLSHPNKPSDAEYAAMGISTMRVWYQANLRPGQTKVGWQSGDPNIQYYNQADIVGLATSDANANRKFVELDIEVYPTARGRTSTEKTKSMDRIREVLGWYKGQNSTTKVGIYFNVPYREHSINHTPGSSDMNALEADHDIFQPLWNEVDFLCPSGYTVVTDYNKIRSMLAMYTREADRLSAARPTGSIANYTTLWPVINTRPQGSDPNEFKYLTGTDWRSFMDVDHSAGGDGFMMWGLGAGHVPTGSTHEQYHDYLYYKDLPWWQQTLNFISTVSSSTGITVG